MNHWAQAASQPGGEAINVELMRSRSFPYPYSMPALLACKAAEAQGGQKVHWDIFDRIQQAHAVEVRNIVDPQVLRECAADIGLDVEQWELAFNNIETRQAVEKDLVGAQERGVHAVPTMIFADKWVLPGLAPEESIRQIIDDILKGNNPAEQ